MGGTARGVAQNLIVFGVNIEDAHEARGANNLWRWGTKLMLNHLIQDVNRMIHLIQIFRPYGFSETVTVYTIPSPITRFLGLAQVRCKNLIEKTGFLASIFRLAKVLVHKNRFFS